MNDANTALKMISTIRLWRNQEEGGRGDVQKTAEISINIEGFLKFTPLFFRSCY